MNKIKKTSIIILYISISLLLVKSINQYVVKTDYFEIKKINIKGNNFVKDETIYKLINNKINHNILDLDLKKLKSKINKNDYIHSSKIYTLLPSTILIEINEIIPLAIFKNNNKKYLLDSNAKSIEADYNALNYYNVPIISNINNHSEKIKVTELLKMILKNDESLYLSINHIVMNNDEINIHLSSNTKIIINTNKTKNELAILFEFIDNISESKKITSYKYIDLTVKDQIIVKEMI
ncbi:MAG: hypothetical protein CMG09_04760 [Candidatus Marinimicrobia bacterium]|nr:hypothetical protein [Candidatus Neomarinimicrobiota bacterium]|tara:strand:- start:3842 stop:4552 length:711 start_codon:yes stop_codon:yes gene_type:complete